MGFNLGALVNAGVQGMGGVYRGMNAADETNYKRQQAAAAAKLKTELGVLQQKLIEARINDLNKPAYKYMLVNGELVRVNGKSEGPATPVFTGRQENVSVPNLVDPKTGRPYIGVRGKFGPPDVTKVGDQYQPPTLTTDYTAPGQPQSRQWATPNGPVRDIGLNAPPAPQPGLGAALTREAVSFQAANAAKAIHAIKARADADPTSILYPTPASVTSLLTKPLGKEVSDVASNLALGPSQRRYQSDANVIAHSVAKVMSQGRQSDVLYRSILKAYFTSAADDPATAQYKMGRLVALLPTFEAIAHGQQPPMPFWSPEDDPDTYIESLDASLGGGDPGGNAPPPPPPPPPAKPPSSFFRPQP